MEGKMIERRQTERKPGDVRFIRLPEPRKDFVRSTINEFKMNPKMERMAELANFVRIMDRKGEPTPILIQCEIKFLIKSIASSL